MMWSCPSLCLITLKHLAQLAAMQPYMFSKQDEEREKKWKEYLSIYDQYVNFYHSELLKNESFSNARDYLKKRSLGKNEVKKFIYKGIHTGTGIDFLIYSPVDGE